MQEAHFFFEGQSAEQILDTRFGKTQEEARNAPWSSGQGVAPDVVVLQKLSDLLNKKDTALETARAWLLQ